MSPFSEMRTLFEAAQISPSKRHNTDAGCSHCLLKMCFHSRRKKKNNKKTSDVPLNLSVGGSFCCVHPATSVSHWIVFTRLLDCLFSVFQIYRHLQIKICVCLCNRRRGLLTRCIFIKKSYLKWILSKTALGKHCHFRGRVKPYKAFPPKWST